MSQLEGILAKIPDESEEDIDISDMKLGDSGVVQISEAIEKGTSATQLYFDGNEITHVGCKALCKALAGTGIMTVSLLQNQIGDDGAVEIGELLSKNAFLKEVDLRDNQIGDKGAAKLAEALESNSTLTRLYLKDNDITNEGALLLAAAVRNNMTLVQLDIEANAIEQEGVSALLQAAEMMKKEITCGYQKVGFRKTGYKKEGTPTDVVESASQGMVFASR
eukprot:CAMPEP_0171099738 /NCGR_PEP_ID=MMETSP0766_2-20121228/52454_1 /TAXON_ID=439317 /ORGANISM="Gambierdiscus australes, Strain CAWD 149" /LENGTH=220 /DNA_ID=CAMNT_0011559435 /DNA_START=60 /DNA_END=722 /DNA_ORIENTATION=+